VPLSTIIHDELKLENGSESGLRGAVSYRFGFNGQEMDNEITGQTGTHTTAMFWEYDCRLGRRWNLDPKPQISISDYACFANNPVWFSDPAGDNAGDYLGEDGRFLGTDKINDGKVYFVKTDQSSLTTKECLEWKSLYERKADIAKSEKNLSNAYERRFAEKIQLLSINSKSVVYRAVWMFGEGATTPMKKDESKNFTDFYAWAIENGTNYTENGKKTFSSEEDMMRKKMNNGGASLYPKFEEGTLGGGYSGYIPKKETIASLNAKMSSSQFKSIMLSICKTDLGLSSDPTKGSFGWGTSKGEMPTLDGKLSKITIQDANDVWHTFGNR